MTIDLSGLQLLEIVIHEIPIRRPGGDTVQPVLSEAAVPLDEELRRLFLENIRKKANHERCFGASFMADASSPVPAWVREHGRDELSFIALSQNCARRLAEIQPSSSSLGLLAVIRGRFQRGNCLVLLKLEHEEGVRVRRNVENGQVRSLSLEHIREIVLSPTTRFFKQAFYQDAGDGLEVLEVVDSQQRPSSINRPVANYFLGAFLGAHVAVEAKEATRRFYQAAREYVDKEIENVEEQLRVTQALISYIEAPAETMSIRNFAGSFIAPEAQDQFVQFLVARKVPEEEFAKDLALIRTSLSHMNMIGKRGYRVIGPSDSWEDRVSVALRDDGESEVTIRDEFRVDRR